MLNAQPIPVLFVGAGPGAADHLTLGALKAITSAEVVIHDRLVGGEILDLIPPQARRIDVGKQGFGPSTPQDRINDLLVTEALTGARVIRLKGGDCGIFGRLDEEIAALEAAGIGFSIVPGLTSATVAAASIGQSLTRRGRNASLRIITGHDIAGFAEQDWRGLARTGEVAAIYMGKKSARFIQGRLMMHGALPETAVTVIENVSRADERVQAATLATLPEAVAQTEGPAVILFGLAPRRAASALASLKEAPRMSRRFTPKIVTANRLREGDVVYLTVDDRWSAFHHEAELIEDEAHAQMRLLHASAQKLTIVGAYLADARPGANGPEPTHFREEFRTRGPSNYHHGKQADLAS